MGRGYSKTAYQERRHAASQTAVGLARVCITAAYRTYRTCSEARNERSCSSQEANKDQCKVHVFLDGAALRKERS